MIITDRTAYCLDAPRRAGRVAFATVAVLFTVILAAFLALGLHLWLAGSPTFSYT